MEAQHLQAKLEMSSSSGEKELCLLEYSFGVPVEMTASCKLFGTLTVTAGDLFDALSLIRLEAEKYGYFILCNGARKDAYPSGMSRNMGRGRKLYLFRNGIPARREDLVDIFEPAEFEQVGTVAEQHVAYETWWKSSQK
jgi:hypothetical protein